jgi:predicted HicB family RNase H-like nuclease
VAFVHSFSHKDYLASVHFSAEDETLYGQIEGIDDLVSFEGGSVAELTAAFHAAVKDYEELCRTVGGGGAETKTRRARELISLYNLYR